MGYFLKAVVVVGLAFIGILIAYGFLAVVLPRDVRSQVIQGSSNYYIGSSGQNGALCDWNILQLVGGLNRIIEAQNCHTGAIDWQSTNASFVFNSVFKQINTNGGGNVHVAGYGFFHAYNITKHIMLPDSGNLQLFGDGAQWTTLQIPTAVNNMNMFELSGTKTADNYFNHFHDFQMTGNRSHGQTNTTGLYFNGINHGWHDSVMRNLFIEDFAQDDVYVTSADSWNVQWENDVFEHAGQYNFNHVGGSDTRIVDCKFLFGHGTYSVFMGGGLNTIQASFFYQNDKNGLLLANSPNVVNGNKFFENGLKASNTYSDIAFSGATATNVVGNTFSASDLTNKTKSGINVGDSTSVTNVIANNNFTPILGGSWGTAPIVGFHDSGVNQIVNNAGWNPKGKITSFIDNSGSYFVSYGGTSSTLVNGTTYTVSDSPVEITSTGGTGVSITLQDTSSNTIQSGLTTLSEQYVPIGYKIKWTWATIPTVGVYFN